MNKKQIITIIAKNEKCSLNRIVDSFLSQDINIENLNLNKINDDLLNINISIDLERKKSKVLIEKLKKLIPVLNVVALDEDNSIQLELALIKLTIKGLSKKKLDDLLNCDSVDILDNKKSKNILIVKIYENSEFINNVINNYKKFIIEVARTGTIAMTTNKK